MPKNQDYDEMMSEDIKDAIRETTEAKQDMLRGQGCLIQAQDRLIDLLLEERAQQA